MYKIAFEKSAEKKFLSFDTKTQEQLAKKLQDLQNGNFTNDKALKGKHKGKFRKRAGNYRII